MINDRIRKRWEWFSSRNSFIVSWESWPLAEYITHFQTGTSCHVRNWTHEKSGIVSVWICFIVCIHSFEDEEDEETWPLVFLLLDFANNPINCVAWRIGTRVNLWQTNFFSYIQYSCNLTTRVWLEGCWSQLVQNSFPVHANTRFPMKSRTQTLFTGFLFISFNGFLVIVVLWVSISSCTSVYDTDCMQLSGVIFSYYQNLNRSRQAVKSYLVKKATMDQLPVEKDPSFGHPLSLPVHTSVKFYYLWKAWVSAKRT